MERDLVFWSWQQFLYTQTNCVEFATLAHQPIVAFAIFPQTSMRGWVATQYRPRLHLESIQLREAFKPRFVTQCYMWNADHREVPFHYHLQANIAVIALDHIDHQGLWWVPYCPCSSANLFMHFVIQRAAVICDTCRECFRSSGALVGSIAFLWKVHSVQG